MADTNKETDSGLAAPDCSASDDLLESLDAWIEDALKGSKPIGLTLARARVRITDQRDRIGEMMAVIERQNQQCHAVPSGSVMKEEISNETAAKLMTLHDAVWQLGNALRDCMSLMETIHETNPELHVDGDIKRCKHTLERYAKGPMCYKQHPFGWPLDLPKNSEPNAKAPAPAGVNLTNTTDE